jgi:hypothetical protein
LVGELESKKTQLNLGLKNTAELESEKHGVAVFFGAPIHFADCPQGNQEGCFYCFTFLSLFFIFFISFYFSVLVPGGKV